MIRSFTTALLLFFAIWAVSQPTVGTLLNTEGSLQGYTFFSPFSGTKAYVVDNCGQLVNSWDRGTRPGLSAYFLENGLMLRTYKADPEGPFTSASNAGGLELVDWNNNTVWSHEFNTPNLLSHHDAVTMPNGNILLLTWDLVFEDELIELGRDPEEIAPEGYMWSEHILEISPLGPSGVTIVWEWEIKDHYIQDFDAAKANYGVVSEHPELFNINLPELNSSNSNSSRDWNHFNSIDYNEELDQILISVRNSDEIWILDHSTTTAEAAGHTGGTYGKGGDILYRWGNGSAYDRAPESDQQLFGQHGAQWIKSGLKDEGKIIIYNNGNGRPGQDYSTAEILDPPQDSAGWYTVPPATPFGPDTSTIIYGNAPGEDFYSPYLSNAQRLVNGNTLINEGSSGYVFEVDSQRNIVWEYIIPLNGDLPATQGGLITNNWTFRVYKYPEDYAGFDGIGLASGNTIELGNSPVDCEIFGEVVSIQSPVKEKMFDFYHAGGEQSIVIRNPEYQNLTLKIFDISGRQLFQREVVTTGERIPLNSLHSGFFIASLKDKQGRRVVKKIFVR